MEPELIVQPELLPILEQLKQFEPLIYAANTGKNTAYFEHLLAPEFWEVGASGRRYSREYVLSELEKRQKNPRNETWHTDGYHLQQLNNTHYLITYTLHQPTRITRRASLWRQEGERWLFVYHQGSVVLD